MRVIIKFVPIQRINYKNVLIFELKIENYYSYIVVYLSIGTSKFKILFCYMVQLLVYTYSIFEVGKIYHRHRFLI